MPALEKDDNFLSLGFTSEEQVLEMRGVREEKDALKALRKVGRSRRRRTAEPRYDGDNDIDPDTGRPWYEATHVPLTDEQVEINRRGKQLGKRAIIPAVHESLMRQTDGDLVQAAAILRAREMKRQREQL